MPATVWMQATAVTQSTTVTPATSNIKDDSNIMTAYNSRNAATAGMDRQHIWTHPKAEMLVNSEASNSMERGQQSKDNRNITASTAEGRPITTRMPEIVETSQQQY
jgi:hypothetical protein